MAQKPLNGNEEEGLSEDGEVALVPALMEVDGSEASPMKAALEELEALRAVFHETLQSYAARIEGEIGTVQDVVKSLLGEEKIPEAKLRDLRDMLTLLRSTQVKTDKGRRKDLKKIDSVVGDLTMLIENW